MHKCKFTKKDTTAIYNNNTKFSLCQENFLHILHISLFSMYLLFFALLYYIVIVKSERKNLTCILLGKGQTVESVVAALDRIFCRD